MIVFISYDRSMQGRGVMQQGEAPLTLHQVITSSIVSPFFHSFIHSSSHSFIHSSSHSFIHIRSHYSHSSPISIFTRASKSVIYSCCDLGDYSLNRKEAEYNVLLGRSTQAIEMLLHSPSTENPRSILLNGWNSYQGSKMDGVCVIMYEE